MSADSARVFWNTYLSTRYTERLAEIEAQPSVGSTRDSYDNAMAETIIGFFNTEVIYPRGPWRTFDDVENATLERVLGTGRASFLRLDLERLAN